MMERITDDAIKLLIYEFKKYCEDPTRLDTAILSCLLELKQRRAEDAARNKALDTARRMIERKNP